MADDESQHQGDGRSQTIEPPVKALSPMTIDIAGPASGARTVDSKPHPDQSEDRGGEQENRGKDQSLA